MNRSTASKPLTERPSMPLGSRSRAASGVVVWSRAASGVVVWGRRGVIVWSLLLIALALGGLTEGLSAQARTVLNGGFETPIITQSWEPVPDTNVPGWTSPDGIIEIWQTGFQGVPAVSGGQFAEANANSPSGFAQNVCLLSGESVPWSFWHRGRSGIDSMIVELGGVEVMRVGTGAGSWVQYSDTYIAPASGPTEVRFTPINTGSLGNFVDDLFFDLTPHVDFGPDVSSAETGTGGPVLYVSGTLNTAETVDLTVTGGTAIPGQDYAGITTVTIPAGIYDGTAATAITVDIGLIDDGVAEGPETVVFDLSNPSAGLRLAHADAAACGAAVKTTATFTIDDDEQSDIQVAKTGATTVANGGTESYSIVTTNAGPAVALGVVLTDTLPPGATFVSATRGATESGGIVTWPAIDTMTVGSSVTDGITLTFGVNGTFDQVAAHVFPGNDPVGSNDRSAVSVTISGCGSPTVTVNTIAELRAAIADSCISTILLSPGTYDLGTGGELSITQDKVLRNAGGGEVILDGANNQRVIDVESGTTVEIDGLTIQNGATGGDGGGIRVADGSLTIRNSALIGNNAGDDGGGLYMTGGSSSLVMENVTLSGNTANDRGGGMDIRNNATITHVTVANNDAANGAGVYVRNSGATLTNTLIADNTGDPDQLRIGGTTFASTNLVEGCSGCGGSVLTGDPNLQPLALNGSETRSHALGTGSIAIDAAATGLATDQHGTGRPNGSGYDLGSYESPPPAGLSVTPDGLASPVQRSVGTEYSQIFTIGNSSAADFDVDFLLSVSPGGGSPFVSLDSITGPGASGIADSVRVLAVPAAGTTDVTAWYTVVSSTVGTVDDLVALGRLVASPSDTDPGQAEVEYVCGSPTTTVSSMAALRAAVADACISTINITPGTYDLTSSGSGEMDIDRDLTIQSTGGGEVILDGANASRIFDVQPGVNAQLTGLTITRGYDPVDGGGINNQGSLVIENGLFFDNRSGDDGAALENAGGSVIIRNSTFSSNLAGDDGGAFQSDGGSVTLIHVTMVGNQAGAAGDETGGAFKLTAGATVSLNNSLLGDNIQGGGSPIDAAGGTVTSNGGNLVEGGCAGCTASDVTIDAQILPLANNGGDSRTHALSSTSAAIDIGQNADGLAVDQRGFARPEGSGYDAGAFERSAAFDVQVRPDGLVSPLSQTDGTGYQYPFWVVNTSTGAQDIDLLGSVAGLVGIPGSSFLTVDSIRGIGITGMADSARVLSVPSGDSAQVDVYYSISGGTLGQVDTLFVQGRLVAQPGVSDFGQIEIGYVCGSGTTIVSTVAALRAAVANACIRTIGVTPGTYDLTSNGSGPLAFGRDLTVYNTGGGEAVIDAGGASRVWEINSGNVDFTGLTIQGGFNNADGGGILNNGNLIIRSSAILNNQTNDDGGGIYSPSGSSLLMENVTVSGNSAGDRGAGVDVQGVGELIHVTIANNSSLGGPAGGLNVRSPGTVTIRNTLIADNTQASGDQLTVAGTLVSNGANLVEGGCSACLASDLTGDPGLLPLALNGGNSRTHQIPSTSIAIDGGAAGDGLATDQRGVARPIGPGYDIGAYEGTGPTSVAVSPDGATSNRLPGNATSYVETYTVQNTGSTTATYTLDARPAGAVLTVDSIRGASLTWGALPDSALTGSLASSASTTVDVYYTVAVVAAGTTDQLVLEASDISVVNVADTGYVDVTVVRPSLELTKGAAVAGTPTSGVDVTYDITVTNTGSEDAVSVIVLDSIPVETDYKLASTGETLPSGITAVVEFADAPGAWGYTPQPQGCGAPTGLDRCVRYVRWVLQAPLPSTAPDNAGDFTFVAVIR